MSDGSEKIISLQELFNAQVDSHKLELIMNEAPWVEITTRLGRKCYSIATIQAIIEQFQLDTQIALNDLQDAIAKIVEGGVPDLAVSTWTGRTQEQENKDFVTSVYDYTELSALKAEDGRVAYVKKDGLQGEFVFSTSSNLIVDNGTVIQGVNGLWLRKFMGRKILTWFKGIDNSGITDNYNKMYELFSNGGEYYIPEGIYKVQGGSVKLGSNLDLLLHDGAIILNDISNPDWMHASLFLNGDLYEANASPTENIKIKGGTLSCQPRFERGYMSGHLQVAHHQNLEIDDVNFIYSCGNTHAIEINACKDVKIKNCTFDLYQASGASLGSREYINIDTSTETGYPWYGPWDNGTCDNILIERNYFKNGDVALGTHGGIDGRFHKNIVIQDNIIENMSSHGISFQRWKNSKITKNEIVNSKNGVLFRYSEDAAVIENTVTNCSNIGIYLSSMSDNSRRSKNIFITNNILKNSGGSGLQEADYVVFSDNTYVDVDAVGNNIISIDKAMYATLNNNKSPPTTKNTYDLRAAIPYGHEYLLAEIERTIVVSIPANTVAKIPLKTPNKQGTVLITTHSSLLAGRPRDMYFYRGGSGEELITPITSNSAGVIVGVGELTPDNSVENTTTINVYAGYMYIANKVGGTIRYSLTF